MTSEPTIRNGLDCIKHSLPHATIYEYANDFLVYSAHGWLIGTRRTLKGALALAGRA